MVETASLPLPSRTLPVLRAAEVAVIGGSLAGVAAALSLRKAGFATVLVEPRTYLGREITATLRPWLPCQPPGELWSALLDRMAARACPPGHEARGSEECASTEIALHMDALKLALEDLLLDTDVGILYASLPVAVRQIVAASTVVDATETALAARLAGGRFEPSGRASARYARTLEFDRVAPVAGDAVPVPAALGEIGNRVALHRGYRDQHLFIPFELDLPAGDGPLSSMRREIAARDTSMALAAFLLATRPAFREASLGSASFELCGPLTGRPHGPAGDPFAGPIPGLWCVNEAARVDDSAAFRHPVAAVQLGEVAAAHILPHAARRPAAHPTSWSEPSISAALEVCELDSPQSGRPYLRRPVPSCRIPVLQEADVLVVGGGTSGATAAITAAREGASTVLLEMNPGLGGTGTIGGVHSYWYGRHVGFAARVEALTAEVHRAIGHTRATWNIEAKMHALLREAGRAGVTVLWEAVTFGTVVEGDQVRGAVAATRWGPIAILADVVIDATGDGDIAAFAGADFVYGAERDHSTMWYSLAQFTTPGRTRNNFTSSVQVSNVEDYTRAILAGRRRGSSQGVHDHGVYLAPRESRHILADVVLTHTDQLLMRHWPDVVNLHYSNHDVKGPSTSPWVRMGLIPPNLEIEVPYRALIPRGLEGLIITGKAISATHDALAAIRMQADLENLGGVAGLAAAQSLREGVSPRAIGVAALQRRLSHEGILPIEVLARPADSPSPTDADLRALVDALDGSRPLYAYSDLEMGEIFTGRIPFVDVCTAGPRIIPYLEREPSIMSRPSAGASSNWRTPPPSPSCGSSTPTHRSGTRPLAPASRPTSSRSAWPSWSCASPGPRLAAGTRRASAPLSPIWTTLAASWPRTPMPTW